MAFGRVAIVCVVVILSAGLCEPAVAAPGLLDKLDRLLGVKTAPRALPAADQRAAARLIARVNRVRRARGLRRLSPSTALMRSSRQYSEWMMARGYFGHGYFSRLAPNARQALGLRSAGENLGRHSGSSAGVARTVRAWLRSPAHRAVMLHPGITKVGAGLAGGRYRGKPAVFWVLHVGS